MKNLKNENPLGVEPIGKLLRKFAVPSIISMLVSSLYNIVDQLFIGQKIGELGNAATNIAFPLSTLCVAVALLLGIGGASAFSLSMGEGKKERATYFIGNSATALFICGVVIMIFSQIFLKPMLMFFGSPDNVLDYAMEYTRICSYGFPFLLLSIGGGHLLRADGRPQMTMICNVSGAVINTILDAAFVFGMNMGMKGAALATVIGQFIACALVVWGLCNCKTVKLSRTHLMVHWRYISRSASLGIANFINQVSMMIVQIIMNKSLKHYGGLSIYGESIPIACVGIITKVNMVFMAFEIGLSQGLQPIVGYNYGAKNYKRVKEAYIKDITIGGAVAVFFFLIFQIFPRNIISAFGNGSELYYQFAVSYFRVFLFFTFANFMHPISSNFFSSIGKPKRGAFLSLTRQILFLLPLILILPLFFGINGIMYAGPVADGMAALIVTIMVIAELRRPEYGKNNMINTGVNGNV
jgi:Na+-driven multidrug efflux pump